MAIPTQFRHYLISQDADGGNIEVARSADQVGVLAFDSHRLQFVQCHVLLEPLKNRSAFENRARKLSETGHPLLARVLEFGEDEGSAYYITESVDGETLASMISRHEEMPVWLAVRLSGLALAALEALAARGDFLPPQPLEALRVVQTGPEGLRVCAADYRLAEPAEGRSSRRLVRSDFEKKARFLSAYFAEQSEVVKVGAEEALLGVADFTELLNNLLVSCGPETRDAIGDFRKSLRTFPPAAGTGALAANSRPRPLIAPQLANFQEIARGVSQTVRMQSQKLDAGQPYALRATLMKSGQAIFVEQVPPARLAGIAPAEALRQSRPATAGLKSGKFPNLVPLVYIGESDGLECMAEVAVEGVTLAELLEARGVLDTQESFLVLTGVDAALGQLEKAARATRRLRLEDIFLFTGIGKENPRVAGLLCEKLHRWPGFSIVLRGHPCLHSMSCRGTDPALLLPVEPRAKGDAEPLWNGGWMAALGVFLISMNEGAGTPPPNADRELVERLLNDELANARKGAPSSRASFLMRYSRVLREHDLTVVGSGGISHGLGGTAGAPAPVGAVGRSAMETAPPKLPPRRVSAAPPEADPEEPPIGFAEALIHPPVALDPATGAGHPGQMAAEFQTYPVGSSWTGFHAEKPVWMRVTTLVVAAMALGAVFAHLQGRALWQQNLRAPEDPTPPAATPVTGTGADAAPGAGPEKPDVPPGPKPGSPGQPKLAPPKKPVLAEVNLDPVPKKAAVTPEALGARLRQLRQSGSALPDELRAETEGAARRGMTEAMIALGNALLRGENGAVDEQAAFTWFDKALRGGDTNAIVPLAGCYLQGWGVAPDFAQAAGLLSRAAAQGDPAAKDLLGVCYARGLGVARDDQKAFRLCSEAHAAGIPGACGNLGAMYLRGQGAPVDPARAAELFAEGSQKGHAESMLLYAQCLENGSGVPADAARAGNWYQQAARLGNAEAAAWCRRMGVAF